MSDEADPAPTAAPKTAPVRSVVDWARAKATPAWLLAATAMRCRWSTDEQSQATECTEAEYLDAVHITANTRL